MAVQNKGTSFPPPGLFASLSAGFEVIANNFAVILMPIAIDIFLWLGPRLRIQTLFTSQFTDWSLLPSEGFFTEKMIRQVIDSFNLLLSVRTFPVGVPSLVVGISPDQTPIGKGMDWQMETLGAYFGALIFITFMGWVLGGLYMYWVSRVTLQQKAQPQQQTPNPIWVTSQSVVLMLVWMVLFFIVLVPGMLILSAFMLVNQFVAQIVFIVFGIAAFWAVVPVFFSAHGIVIYRQNAIASIAQAFKLARFTMPTTSLFVLFMFIISQGLAYLWRTPPTSSWMLLVGIIGHAFISTALLAGSLIYYRDTNAWLQVMLERIKAQTTSHSAQA